VNAKAEEEATQFCALFDLMPQLGWTAKADGHIDFYNQGWYDYTGTTLKRWKVGVGKKSTILLFCRR